MSIGAITSALALLDDIREHGDYLVTVCGHCLRASCWHGYYYCDHFRDAGTSVKRASRLLEMNLEHPDKFSRATVLRECGDVEPTP